MAVLRKFEIVTFFTAFILTSNAHPQIRLPFSDRFKLAPSVTRVREGQLYRRAQPTSTGSGIRYSPRFAYVAECYSAQLVSMS